MISAFLIGLLGSVHCVGMCGPLMLAFTPNEGSKRYIGFFTYHFGRLLVYMGIGVVFGLLSSSLVFFHFQQWAAIILGLTIISIYAIPGLRNQLEGRYFHSSFYAFAKAKLIQGYTTKFKWLFAGMLNGLLPCGMVYLAAAGALLTGSLMGAMSYMVLFGLGTLPALIGLLTLTKSTPKISRVLTRAITPVAILSGVLLVFRGLTVNDPEINQLIHSQIANMVTACGF
jgi:sulfite exporter TauE/SafE